MIRAAGVTMALVAAATAAIYAGQAKPDAGRGAPPAARVMPADTGRILLSPAQAAELRTAPGWPGRMDSLLNVAGPMRFGDYLWRDDGVPDGPVTVRVDLARQTISVMRGGHEIGTAVILFGADGHPTPPGTFPIRAKLRDHVSRSYDSPMPFTLRLTGDGVAIHGSDVRAGAATHGCIGIPTEFARELFAAAAVGDLVTIV